MKKVTQIICFYNEEKYLEKAIYSILNQSYKNIELVVINDGSTDSSEKIVEKIQDSRLTYISNAENHGLAWCRNQGLDIATGEYVGFFDADDIAVRDKIEKQVSFLESNKDVFVVSGNYDYMNAFGEIISGKNQNIAVNDLEIRASMLFGNCIAGPCALFRREIIEKHHIRHDVRMSTSQDYYFWLKCLQFGKIRNIDEVLFHYRINHGSKSNVRRKNNQIEYDTILKGIIKYAWESRGFVLLESEIDFIFTYLYRQKKAFSLRLFFLSKNLLKKIDIQSEKLMLIEKEYIHNKYIKLMKNNNRLLYVYWEINQIFA